jgi:hypothetical protein
LMMEWSERPGCNICALLDPKEHGLLRKGRFIPRHMTTRDWG